MRLFRWFRRPKPELLREQLDRFRDAKVDGKLPIKPPRVVYAEHVQTERRHAAPTICGRCNQPTGYNDGVQPCNACFVAGLEAAQDAIDAAKPSKVTRFERREK